MSSSHLKTLDVNADMGEGFGNYQYGNDELLMEHITTANIACGFHAGDPLIMRNTVNMAIEHSVALGAHPGTPDLMGFGRRTMTLTPEDVFAYVTYQAGALAGFARQQGMKLHHIKPHGAMYNILKDETLASAAIEAIQTIEPSAFFYWIGPMGHEPISQIAADAGMRVVMEAYPDLSYTPEGNLIVERVKKPVDPKVVADRVRRILVDQTFEAIDGTIIPMQVESVCIHSDGPNAADVARAIRDTAESVGVGIAPVLS
jgi:5-oxoprolinase (ATP-hydrolysing) subunit A